VSGKLAGTSADQPQAEQQLKKRRRKSMIGAPLKVRELLDAA